MSCTNIIQSFDFIDCLVGKKYLWVTDTFFGGPELGLMVSFIWDQSRYGSIWHCAETRDHNYLLWTHSMWIDDLIKSHMVFVRIRFWWFRVSSQLPRDDIVSRLYTQSSDNDTRYSRNGKYLIFSGNAIWNETISVNSAGACNRFMKTINCVRIYFHFSLLSSLCETRVDDAYFGSGAVQIN